MYQLLTDSEEGNNLFNHHMFFSHFIVTLLLNAETIDERFHQVRKVGDRELSSLLACFAEVQRGRIEVGNVDFAITVQIGLGFQLTELDVEPQA